jgi:thioester reductase-like protein
MESEVDMASLIYSRKLGAAIVAAAIMLIGAFVECHAETGTVRLTVVKAGFIVSTGSGTGTLNYQGRTYRLSVSTVGYGTIGATGGELAGNAYNLRTAADIAGSYQAAAAGFTVGGAAQVARFQNANGVILELVGAQLGLAVTLGSAGMTIVLQ